MTDVNHSWVAEITIGQAEIKQIFIDTFVSDKINDIIYLFVFKFYFQKKIKIKQFLSKFQHKINKLL